MRRNALVKDRVTKLFIFKENLEHAEIKAKIVENERIQKERQ